ncbi:MAG: ubiquinol oxidase subunit II [Candidatus Saccharimonadales bacterium]
MNKQRRVAFIGGAILWLIGILAFYLRKSNFAVLNPMGEVAAKERNLLIFTVLLGLLVVVPVFIMTFTIAWKYREGNTKANYKPDWDHNLAAETLWWGIPSTIIVLLSVITWNSSHALDPHKPLSAAAPPMTIQVVALNWKWLFIYPRQGVASVNEVHLPVNQPVTFEITADAPMNSFWIPQLGGQIYAMPGMSTRLNLMATKAGAYKGSSANLSGKGFAGMKFTAIASSQTDLKLWLASAQRSSSALDAAAYHRLAQPSENNKPTLYSSAESALYDRVVMKYMVPGAHDD